MKKVSVSDAPLTPPGVKGVTWRHFHFALGLRFGTINMGREMHGISGAETASDKSDFGYADT
jgi:hypothetical protein